MKPHNWRAYNHYLECKATGCWPDDWIVRRNAALILAVEESAARQTQQRHMHATEALGKILVTWIEAMSMR